MLAAHDAEQSEEDLDPREGLVLQWRPIFFGRICVNTKPVVIIWVRKHGRRCQRILTFLECDIMRQAPPKLGEGDTRLRGFGPSTSVLIDSFEKLGQRANQRGITGKLVRIQPRAHMNCCRPAPDSGGVMEFRPVRRLGSKRTPTPSMSRPHQRTLRENSTHLPGCKRKLYWIQIE
jgi:hypothetical protein